MEKKKSKNASICGVNLIDEQVLFPVTDDCSVYIEKLNADYWERLRRNKEYLKLCRGVKFHPTGLISPGWVQANMDKFCKIKNQGKQLFGIEEILDPGKGSEEFQPDMINTFGIAPIIVKALLPESSKKDFNNQEEYSKRFIEDNRHIILKIDITHHKLCIFDLIETYIDFYRNMIDFEPIDTKKRFDIWREGYKIYDLIESGESHTDIIKMLWRDEFEKCANKKNYPMGKKYEELVRKYRGQGLENWNEKAYEEAYEKEGNITKLYARVYDKHKSAKRRIEEILLD